MVSVYVKLIMSGRRTIEQVPSIIREDVIHALIDNGFLAEGGEDNG